MIPGRRWLALVLVCVLTGALPGAAAAALSPTQMKCSATIAKVGLGVVRNKMKLYRKCRIANLQAPGSCANPNPSVLARIDESARKMLVKKCTLTSAGLAGLGFPGPCTDATPGGFSPEDLAECIRVGHDAIIGQMLALQFDPTVGAVSKDQLACQQEVAKESGDLVACVLKSVQKCRAAIARNKLPGVLAHLCATDDPKTAAIISKCRAKLDAGIRGLCNDADAASLALCAPDTTTVDDAIACLVDRHTILTDGPAIDVPVDLIDYQYAVRGGLCGDGVVNNLGEECDGDDDDACPGACGAALHPNGYFACLCTTKPRLRIVEHRHADTDNGWIGSSADTGVAEGGGYVADLYDCDASGLCNVGPSCSLPPHSPCSVYLAAPSGLTGDFICESLGQGVCRKERTATGPHCFKDIQKKCDPNDPGDPVCDDIADSCAVTLVGPPNPVSSGGITVCNVTIFSEDVVGTANLSTGESLVRAPQRSRTYAREIGSANKPCPVCGGFCGLSKERCSVNADCGSQGPCVTAEVCSDGLNAGRVCRTTVPFGNASEFFGTTSVDCPPNPDIELTSDYGLDLYITERTTGMVTMYPTEACSGEGFTGNACVGGIGTGRPCTTWSECPGGTCAPQCFCPEQIRPNACDSACVGGDNDAQQCISDGECPGGFCHKSDCRHDPNDGGSVQEGICTTGPIESWCSVTTYRPCDTNAECQKPACPYCADGEACVARNRPCFVNGGIIREGEAHGPEGVSVGVYCIQGDHPGVNVAAGFPGPAAFTQPELQVVVP